MRQAAAASITPHGSPVLAHLTVPPEAGTVATIPAPNLQTEN